MVTCHCKMFESSTKPAEKPSIGFRVKSVSCFKRTSRITPHRQRGVSSRKGKKETPPVRDLTTRYKRKEKLDFPPRPFVLVVQEASGVLRRRARKKQDFGHTPPFLSPLS